MSKHAADSHDLIRVQSARVNNLKNLSVEIPKRRLTVFTGVSGSGKSSLVFGTIAAESQRLINETYSAFLQNFMPSQARPDVDVLEGLTTAIIVDQERMGANARSTVGTATDANAMLRILFSRIGSPHIGPPTAFSFNVPTRRASGAMTAEKGEKFERTVVRDVVYQGGMCPKCEGMGQVNDIDLRELYDDTKSLSEGALKVPGYSSEGWHIRAFAAAGVDPKKPIKKFSKKELDIFLHDKPRKVKVEKINLTYEGLIPRIQRGYLTRDVDTLQPHIRAFVERAVTFTTCPACKGTRLNDNARSSKIKGKNIADVCAMQISDLSAWLRNLRSATSATSVTSVGPLLEKLGQTLESFVEIGLGYLSLDRPAGTLSGGEAQRTKMVGHLGSSLTDVTYVFDEPTIGLHPHDIRRMNQLLLRLRDHGNTVLVVEHKPEVMAIADHVIDLGPGAGTAGGEVVFEGSVDGLRKSGTLTGRHISDRASLKTTVRQPTGFIKVRGAKTNNLKNVDVDIPLGVLVVITGVAGSGKSSLIHGSVSNRDGVIAIDQTMIRGSRRSNPATYTGLLDPIRIAFAKANNVKPALFSANSEGACPACNGAGVIYTDLGMMAGVSTTCEECEGKRFRAPVLKYKLPSISLRAGGGLNIAEVLDLPVKDAVEFFGAGQAHTPAAHPSASLRASPSASLRASPSASLRASEILTHMNDVGLGYLRLGQPLTTLSGGERQRLKLATAMSEGPPSQTARGARSSGGTGPPSRRSGEASGVYVLDEPTTGLHLADLAHLLALLDRLVDSGKSVIVIEHHLSVMAHADWIIDLGPGAGHDGGRVVFEGTPASLTKAKKTLTGEHLAALNAGLV